MNGLLAAVAIIIVVWLALIVALALFGKRDVARELASLVPNLTRLFAGLLRDPRVPRRAKVVLGLTALYLAFPIDLIPDFIPVLGYADDAIIVAIALRSITRRAGPEVLEQHWPGSPEGLDTLLMLAGLTSRTLPT